MSTLNTPTDKSVEGIVGTDSGNQRVVMIEAFSGTQLSYNTNSVEVICEDGLGNKQRCVAVTHFSDSESSPVPDQTGHGGQFLRTNGSSLLWDDALQNGATGSLAIGIEGDASGNGAISIGMGSSAEGQSSISIGTSAESSGDDSVCIGGIAKDNGENYNTIIGGRAEATKQSNVVIGCNSSSSAIGAVVVGYQASATVNGTFVVGLSIDGINTTNYTVINSDGKINPTMFANVPSSNGNYLLRATVNNGVITYSWVAE